MERKLGRYPFLLVDTLSLAKYHNQGGREVGDLFSELKNSPQGKIGKLLAMTHLVEKAAPGFEEFMSELLLSFDGLPMKVDEIKFAGRGGEQNVFKVASGERIFALKIHKLSQMSSGCDFDCQVKRVREEYMRVRKWYGHIDRFIPDEFHFVGHSPIFNLSALMTIQPFVERKTRGVFESFDKDTFVDVLGRNTRLKISYVLFAKRLVSLWRNKGVCLDLLGENNLSVLGRDFSSCDLYFGDPHNIISRGQVLFGGIYLPVDIVSDIFNRLEERVDWVDRVACEVG